MTTRKHRFHLCAQVDGALVDALTKAVWTARGLTRKSPRLPQVLASLMRGHVPVKRSRPFEVLEGRGVVIPTLGTVYLPRPAYSLSGEATPSCQEVFFEQSEAQLSKRAGIG